MKLEENEANAAIAFLKLFDLKRKCDQCGAVLRDVVINETLSPGCDSCYQLMKEILAWSEKEEQDFVTCENCGTLFEAVYAADVDKPIGCDNCFGEWQRRLEQSRKNYKYRIAKLQYCGSCGGTGERARLFPLFTGCRWCGGNGLRRRLTCEKCGTPFVKVYAADLNRPIGCDHCFGVWQRRLEQSRKDKKYRLVLLQYCGFCGGTGKDGRFFSCYCGGSGLRRRESFFLRTPEFFTRSR